MPTRLPFTRGIYRGDLLRAISPIGGGKPMSLEQACRLCGFEFTETPAEPPRLPAKPAAKPGLERTGLASEELPGSPVAPSKFPFWHVASLTVESGAVAEERQRVPEAVQRAVRFRTADFEYTFTPTAGKPLLPWSRLWPFLREVLGRAKPGREPDLPRVLDLLVRCRPLVRLPRKLRRGWHPKVHLLVDRRLALAPFWDDFSALERRLKKLRGRHGLVVETVDLEPAFPPGAGPVGSPPLRADWRTRLFRATEPAVLVLGDLNQYQNALLQTPWLSLGRQLRRRGLIPWALSPCPRHQWSARMARVWNLACWDRGQRLPKGGQGLRALPRPAAEVALFVRQQVATLLPLLSPAIRVERGLLRDLRFHLPGSQADAGTEYAIFNQVPGDSLAFSLPTEQLWLLRSQLAGLDSLLLARAVATLRRHHAYCQGLFGHMEVMALHDVLPPHRFEELVAQGVLPVGALADAQTFKARMARTLWERPTDFATDATGAFYARDLDRLQGFELQDPIQQAIWSLVHPGHNRQLRAWVLPENIDWQQAGQAQERSHPVVLGRTGDAGGRGWFPLGQIHSPKATYFAERQMEGRPQNERAELAWGERGHASLQLAPNLTSVSLSSGRETLHLAPLQRPAWARRLGYDSKGLWADAGPLGSSHRLRWRPPVREDRSDAHGVDGYFAPENSPFWAELIAKDACGWFAEFSVGSVPFVLRWIPPGRFLMGSPEDEPGRNGDEGPRHQVTISQGFWLGDAPVTQAQWRAVVEAISPQKQTPKKKSELNPEPSHFQGPDSLPVERVSWEDCTLFCQLLTAHLQPQLSPGFGFRLPTEAQWEYACRAGTESALYTGDITLRGERDAPELDDIAWYGGNSGRELEVTNPFEAKDWPNRQYPDRQAGTHRVKLKAPNPWGLYDVIGNVGEWCSDSWDPKAYELRKEGHSDTPSDVKRKNAYRVVRAGCWADQARDARLACRFRDTPGSRGADLGLRLAAGQEPVPAEPSDRKGGSRG